MTRTLNIKPRTIFCHDNLPILEGINSDSIDLIYLDPPFNKKKTFTAPVGSSAEGAEFSDIFREKDVKAEWVKTVEFENPILFNYLNGVKSFSNTYNYCYLVYMAVRLIECQRILKNTGSLYLHCDPTMSHYLKIVLDCVFGETNFRNEISWHYGKWSNSARCFQNNHDTIFFYTKTNQYTFNPIYAERRNPAPYNIQGGKVNQLLVYNRDETPPEIIKREKEKGRKVIYVENKGGVEHDVWSYLRDKEIDYIPPRSLERTGYPTQKPLFLLERIISVSTNENDIVLDPFCGCATTCVAAEKLGRDWVGVDVSQKAYELVKMRLAKEVPADLLRSEPDFLITPPVRGKSEKQKMGYVYIISNAKADDEYKYKVGIAKDVEKRLSGLQTGTSNRGLVVNHKIKTPYYKELEKHIHNTFPNQHEWVKAELDEIIDEMKSYLKR